MKTMNVQFHITIEELVTYFYDIVISNELKSYGVMLFPNFKVEDNIVFSADEIKKYNFIILSKNNIDISNKEKYKNYLNKKKGDLIISIGNDDGIELSESSIGVISNNEIDELWKKIIKDLKKILRKGAFVVNIGGDKKYYPNHMYTSGAKKAFENGIVIKPIAGWNKYELVSEENTSD